LSSTADYWLKKATFAADACPVVQELTVKPSTRAGAKERRRRAEALSRYRADARVKSLAQAGELAYLREQLRLAARLTSELAGKSDVAEMAQLVVDELHETFAFYLAAIQRLDEDGVLRLVAGRGPLAEVMTEFLLTEQPVSEGVNGKVARSGQTHLISDTREDPDYIVRDPTTDPLSELAVPVLVALKVAAEHVEGWRPVRDFLSPNPRWLPIKITRSEDSASKRMRIVPADRVSRSA